MTDKESKKQSFKVKELEKLMKLGRKLDVSELKVGEIHIIFGLASPQVPKPRKAPIKKLTPEEQIVLDKETKEVQDKSQLQFRLNEVSENIEVAHIEDPEAYEEAIIAGELGEETVQDTRPQ